MSKFKLTEAMLMPYDNSTTTAKIQNETHETDTPLYRRRIGARITAQ